MRYRIGDMSQQLATTVTASRAAGAGKVHPEWALLHPVWWGALVLLVVNDQLLKGSGILPAVFTGKLSDLAGLIVAPVVLAAIVVARSRLAAAGCFATVASWFIAINISPAAARWCEQLTAALGLPWRIWSDPADLLALPALAISWWLVSSSATRALARPWSAWRRAVRFSAMALGALACVATSRPLPPPAVTMPGSVLSQAWDSAPLQVIDIHGGRAIGQLDGSGWIGPSVHVDDTFYALGWRFLTATAIPSGEQLFRYEVRQERFQPTLAADGQRLFVITAPLHRNSTELLVALDRQRPQRLWTTPLPSKRRWRSRAHGLVHDAGLLLVPAEDRLLAVDPATGAVLWTHRGATALGWPLVLAANVYVAGLDGRIYALDIETGAELWRHRAGSEDAFVLRPWRARPLSGAQGLLIYGTGSSLVAIDGVTRAPRWRRKGVQDAVIGDTTVFAKLGPASYAALDVADGHSRWRLEGEELGTSRPILAEDAGLVILRPHASRLHAHDLGTGALRWTFDLEAGVRVADAGAGRVLAGAWAR